MGVGRFRIAHIIPPKATDFYERCWEPNRYSRRIDNPRLIESLANHVTEEDVHALADKINIFFHSVSKDLPPTSEIAIPSQSL